jgi:NAD(P)-dependent dehydrogenase (short-subunit alcohol dehydrogenase family)
MSEAYLASGSSSVNVDLTKRSAIVTGAASGIGRACAERLSQAGAAVTVIDLDGDAAREVAEGIGGEAVQADLSDYEVLKSLEIDTDIVVNNAGLQHVAAVEKFPPIKRMIEPEEVAEFAAFLCTPEASFINGASLVMDGGATGH